MAKLRKLELITPPVGQQNPSTVPTTRLAYARDPVVKAWVLQNARGICEGCGIPAPFVGDDGEPFLESHHVRPLADKGSDTITKPRPYAPTAIDDAIWALTGKNSQMGYTGEFPAWCGSRK